MNNTGRYDGVVGLLQSGDIEFSATALLFKATRLDIMDYAGETFRFE